MLRLKEEPLLHMVFRMTASIIRESLRQGKLDDSLEIAQRKDPIC